MIEVPVRVLRVMARRNYGHRLPKRKKEYTMVGLPVHLRGIVPIRALGGITEPFEPFGFARGRRDEKREKYRQYSRRRGEAPPQVGNLNNNDYRFWIGCENEASEYSMCRACGTICFNAAHRRLHKEAEKCTDLLVEAYKLALREKLCLVCERATIKEKWGLPLHPECVEKWMFDEETLMALAPLVQGIRKNPPPNRGIVIPFARHDSEVSYGE